MFGFLGEGKVLITERIDHQHPFVKILRYRLSIPPVLIIPPLLQLQNFSHSQHYILHYQVVQTNMLKKNQRCYFEEKLRWWHFAVVLWLQVWLYHLCQQYVVHKQAYYSCSWFYQQVYTMNWQQGIMILNEIFVYNHRRYQKFYFMQKVLGNLWVFESVKTVAGSFDRHGPTNNNNKNPIGKVEIHLTYKIQPSPHKHTSKNQTIAKSNYFPPLHISQHFNHQIPQIQFHHRKTNHRRNSSSIFNQITTDNMKNIPFEYVALVDVICHHVYHCEMNCDQEHQALETWEYRVREHGMLEVWICYIQQWVLVRFYLWGFFVQLRLCWHWHDIYIIHWIVIFYERRATPGEELSETALHQAAQPQRHRPEELPGERFQG